MAGIAAVLQAGRRRWLTPYWLLLGLLLVPAFAPVGAAETTTLNLKNADIRAVIQTVSELTDTNFVIDPRVKGKVTVVSPRPMAPDEVYQVFLSVLNVHGFAAVPGENSVKIVPEVHAKQGGVPTASGRRPGEGDEYVTRVVPIRHVQAAQLVPVLRPLLPQHAHLAAYPPSNVLIASATAGAIRRLVEVIGRVDVAADGGTEVISLEHASAEEVVRVLNEVQGGQGQGQGGPGLRLAADLRTNSVLLSGDKTRRLRARTIISHLDTPLEQTGNTQVFYLRYANAKDLVPVLTGVGENIAQQEQGGQQGQTGQEKVSIQADESTNALVVNAPPTLMRDLGAVIRKLDVRRAQVFVEAVIAEVSTDKTKELGVQWAYDGSSSSQPVGVINFGGSGSGLTNLLADPPVIGDGISLALGDTDLEGNGARGAVLLRALAGDADTNVLSTPNLVTMDNQEAEIVVGQNVPFVTGSYTSAGGGSTPDNPFQTIERRDVGLTLRVKPQINEGDAVKLEVEQEVSSLSSASTGASDVVTNKRSLKTTVLVDDGQAVVLGGLIDDTLRESVQKVPGLGDLPVVGGLFSYKQTNKVKRNLMVFLRPVILRDAAQSAAVAGEKYSYMRARQVAVREGGVSQLPKDQVPVMQKMEAWMSLPPPFEESKQGRQPGAVPPPLNRDERAR